jgi:hypothetical protein
MARISCGIAVGIAVGFVVGLGLVATMLVFSSDSVADIGN